MGRTSFDPASDIPDLSGKVIFITGGTAGLGAQSVLALAKHRPAHIFFSGRNAANAQTFIDQVQASDSNVPVTFISCDLASLTSVKTAAASFLAQSNRLDVLMCNAGIMAHQPSLTPDGYELQFGTNYLGHSLLVKQLLPTLLNTSQLPGADVRVIILTSLGFRVRPKGGIIFDGLKTVQDFGSMGPWLRYGQSKLANLLYAREIARRYPDITSVSVHPGVVDTGIVGNLSFMKKLFIYAANGRLLKPNEGAYNQLWATSVDKSKIQNGQFYEPIGVLSNKLDRTAKDDKLAEQLWDWTEKELENY